MHCCVFSLPLSFLAEALVFIPRHSEQRLLWWSNSESEEWRVKRHWPTSPSCLFPILMSWSRLSSSLWKVCFPSFPFSLHSLWVCTFYWVQCEAWTYHSEQDGFHLLGGGIKYEIITTVVSVKERLGFKTTKSRKWLEDKIGTEKKGNK